MEIRTSKLCHNGEDYTLHLFSNAQLNTRINSNIHIPKLFCNTADSIFSLGSILTLQRLEPVSLFTSERINSRVPVSNTKGEQHVFELTL